MRKNRNNPNRKFEATHFEDPLKDWLSGRGRRKKAIHDAMQLSNEVLHRRHELFPIRSIPVPDKPGYVTHDQNFFRITTRGKRISSDLNTYFTNEHNYFREEGLSYGQAHVLGEFFNFALHDLLMDGVTYYAVEWEKVKIGNRNYYLPIDLLWINPSTFVRRKVDGKTTQQKYSWVSKEVNEYYEYGDHIFKEHELLMFKYPGFYPSSPVKKSMRLLDEIRVWWRFTLWQGKANNERENHSFPLERTRYKVSTEYKRKEDMARALVKKIFREPVTGVIPITEYYEVYSYKESKKHLNTLREAFVREFNNQLLKQVQKKNNIKSDIKLEFRGFTSNKEIDEWFSFYKKGGITANEFVEAVKDDFNKDLY